MGVGVPGPVDDWPAEVRPTETRGFVDDKAGGKLEGNMS